MISVDQVAAAVVQWIATLLPGDFRVDLLTKGADRYIRVVQRSTAEQHLINPFSSSAAGAWGEEGYREIVVYVILDQVQDFVAETTREPWPTVSGSVFRGMLNPIANIVAGELVAGYEGAGTLILGMPRIAI